VRSAAARKIQIRKAPAWEFSAAGKAERRFSTAVFRLKNLPDPAPESSSPAINPFAREFLFGVLLKQGRTDAWGKAGFDLGESGLRAGFEGGSGTIAHGKKNVPKRGRKGYSFRAVYMPLY